MTHTDDDTVVSLAIRDLIVANKTDLGVDTVLYGNHSMIPDGTTVVVTSNGKNSDLVGVQGPGGRRQNAMVTSIELHRSVVGDEETQRIAVDAIGTAIEKLLHSDTSVGGIVIHGFVNSVERGTTTLNLVGNNSMFRTVLMTFTSQTRTIIQ